MCVAQVISLDAVIQLNQPSLASGSPPAVIVPEHRLKVGELCNFKMALSRYQLQFSRRRSICCFFLCVTGHNTLSKIPSVQS